MSEPRDRRRDQGGQTTVLVTGLAVVLMLAIAMVVNVSAAYLQRQGLDNLAEGAALAAADAGAEGGEVYTGGLDGERLALFERTAREAVDEYLAGVGAAKQFPGLHRSVRVDVEERSVRVQVSAPMELPLSLPGGPRSATVAATGAAAVSPEP